MQHLWASLTCFVIFLAGSAAIAADTSGCQPGEMIIKFSHVTAETGHPKGRAAKALAERINSELDGRACMIVYPNAELYSDDDALWDAMRAGEVQMAAPSLAKISQFSKGFQIFDLPFMFRDMIEVIDFTYTREALALLASMEGSGLTGQAYWVNGMRQISANRALETPGDIAGLTFRIQGSPVERAYYDMLGAETKKMSFSQVYDALKNGEIDGQENSWSNIYTKQFHTVQHSINETNHSLIAYALIVASDFWEGLPPDLRADLDITIQEVTHEYNGLAFQLDELNRERVLKSSTPVRILRRREREVWREAFLPVWNQFATEIGPELLVAATR